MTVDRNNWRSREHLETLRGLRVRVARRELTISDAAALVGIPRGTLCSRWRSAGIDKEIPIVHWTKTAQRVSDAIRETPQFSDAQIAEQLGICRTTVQKYRVIMGVCGRDARMAAIDAQWGRPSDAELRDARARVVARTATVRQISAEMGMCQQWVYGHWHRMGLMGGQSPRGFVVIAERRKRKPCPVRDEVRAHLTEYPWMAPDDIANSMTADGYPISVRAVEAHIEHIEREGSLR